MEEEEVKKHPAQQSGKFVAFLKKVFVHNIGWKLLSLGASFIIWVLVAGLW